ncbi:MAG: hypothetical protein FWK04_00520 [Nostoc sp. GBBB01]|jgi:hypothetical protein|nr:hypothetical protein [Nostoc sp. GBBB01]
MPKIAAIFTTNNDANVFENLLSSSPWSNKVKMSKYATGDIFNIINTSSSIIKLSSRENIVIEIEASHNEIENLKIIIHNQNGIYIPEDDRIKWGI